MKRKLYSLVIATALMICLAGAFSGTAFAAEDPELFKSCAVLQKGEPLVYAEPLMRAGKVYIFGGGHVGQALVPVLANIGFRVTVYDNREELADKSHFPSAENVMSPAEFISMASYS